MGRVIKKMDNFAIISLGNSSTKPKEVDDGKPWIWQFTEALFALIWITGNKHLFCISEPTNQW